MLHAEVRPVTKSNEEEQMEPAYNPSSDPSSLELQTVMGVEKVLKKVRAFTCLVIGNRVEADEIVEDALILYLSTDPDPSEADGAHAYLVSAVRRLLPRSSVTRLINRLEDEGIPSNDAALLVMLAEYEIEAPGQAMAVIRKHWKAQIARARSGHLSQS